MGDGKQLSRQMCAGDDRPDANDPSDLQTCSRCMGTGREPKIQKSGVIEMKFKAFIPISTALLMLTTCNRQIIDATYKYDKAIISLPNGEIIEGNVQSWGDYADGDQLQIKIDGVTYLVHSMNVVLLAE